MNEISSRIAGLIAKNLNNELDEQERRELESWAQESNIYREILERFTNEKLLFKTIHDSYSNEELIWNQIKEHMLADRGTPAKVMKMRRFIWIKITSAAAIVILLSIGAFVWFTGKQNKQVAATENQTKINDLEPGKDGAILKLADGKEIVLDNSTNGNLARQGNSDVIKQGTELRYSNEGNYGSEIFYNTLSTPRGRQFQLVLPDGTRVWLNSASSITFPTAFEGKDRLVQIEGEVYMEVAKDASHPFKASVNGMQVEVTGTSFNIQAYRDEPLIRTTLLEGGVRITPAPSSSGSGKSTNLKPGQQVQVRNDNSIAIIDNVDVEQVTAWKNGLFQFSNDDLKTVLRRIARWYDVDVVFNGPVPNAIYGGKIRMDSKLSEVLVILDKYNIHFKIEGRKIIVSP
jgi:transmembrane sensor